jgi:hypothetical protein
MLRGSHLLIKLIINGENFSSLYLNFPDKGQICILCYTGFLGEEAKHLTLFYSEDRGSRFLWNAGNHPPITWFIFQKVTILILRSLPPTLLVLHSWQKWHLKFVKKYPPLTAIKNCVTYCLPFTESKATVTCVLSNIPHIKNVWNKGSRSQWELLYAMHKNSVM